MNKTFSIRGALRYGWSAMKKHFWLFVGMWAVILLVNFGFSFLQGAVEKSALAVFVVAVASMIVQQMLAAGVLVLLIKVYMEDKVKVLEIFDFTKQHLRYVWATVLYSLIIMGGLILLIVPGVIWALKYQFYGYVLMEEGEKTTVWGAFQKSAGMTKGVRGKLLGFGFVLVGVYVLGFLALVVGLFAALPVAFMAMTWVYFQLKNIPEKQIEEQSVIA